MFWKGVSVGRSGSPLSPAAPLCRTWVPLLCLGFAAPGPACAGGLDEFRVQRQEIFEFTRKPKLARQGDRVEISFSSKGFCDATVAIEDAGGTILRHLACGLLGNNAPEPFQKSTLDQALVWDGKDDQGRYSVDQDRCVVRVSLGLKPSFERVLYWEPRKTISRGEGPLLQAAPEGVYVFEGRDVDHVRLFDHEGQYLRTIYPFPANKLEQIQGLVWAPRSSEEQKKLDPTFWDAYRKGPAFPPEAKFPLKTGFTQTTFLTSGNSADINDYADPTGKWGAKAMAVRGKRIALAFWNLNRLATDGTTGGLPLHGPAASFPFVARDAPGEWRNKKLTCSPWSAAFSPDGRWLYLTGFESWIPYSTNTGLHYYIHAVARIDFETNAPPELFAGSFEQGSLGGDDRRLNTPVSVACDRQGRVYVADYMNDRIQVFTPDRKLIKSISFEKPAQITIHPRTDELYVFSWYIPAGQVFKFGAPRLVLLGTVDNPHPQATYPVPLNSPRASKHEGGAGGYGYRGPGQYRAELDFFTDPPTLWLAGEGELKLNAALFSEKNYTQIRLLALANGTWTPKRNFEEDAQRSVVRTEPPVFSRQRLHVNPVTGRLYVQEDEKGYCKAHQELVEIDPDSGKIRIVSLPYSAEDVAFDTNGWIYLRTLNEIGRFDPSTWREIPWDYGEERDAVGFGSGGFVGKRAPLVSALPVRAQRYNHQGGLYVSPQGHLAVFSFLGGAPKLDIGKRTDTQTAQEETGGKKYTPPLYPGRVTFGIVTVYDKHGHLIHEDAIPGLNYGDGIGLDRDDNLYLLPMACRYYDGKKYFNDMTETLIKFRPKQGKIISADPDLPAVPVNLAARLERPYDLETGGRGQLGPAWVEGAEWMYGGLGWGGKNASRAGGGCNCWSNRFALDYFGRSFAPETNRYSVAVLDSNGNLILRVGQYGNADSAGPGSPVPLGGDEVGLFHACYLTTHTDRRLFIADSGNARIVGVKLSYHASETVSLRAGAGAAPAAGK